MTYREMIQYALEENFSDAAVVDTDQITFDSSFRDYCAENICGQFGANHSCPPGCSSPEKMKQRILAHRKALVLQSIWEIADYSDWSIIKPAQNAHNAAQLRLAQRFQSQGCNGLLVGAGGCSLCSPCAQLLNQPCRFPEQRFSCMSAYCIFVKKLADCCAMEYDCGEGLLAFFGMFVFD